MTKGVELEYAPVVDVDGLQYRKLRMLVYDTWESWSAVTLKPPPCGPTWDERRGALAGARARVFGWMACAVSGRLLIGIGLGAVGRCARIDGKVSVDHAARSHVGKCSGLLG